MSFRISKKDASPGDAARRIAGEQVDKAIEAIDSRERADAIHDVRKRCKKVRGLLRLVRPGFAGYAAENARFRDLAKLVSGARDAKVMQDTFDVLLDTYPDEMAGEAIAAIRQRFTLDREAGTGNSGGDPLAEAREQLEAARKRIDDWKIEGQGWRILGKGLKKNYAKARDAASAACGDGGAAAFHDLRKPIKYHWSHCRLLAKLWPQMMAVRIDAANTLSELLGAHHDLAVFEETLSADPSRYGDVQAVETACALAARRRGELEQQASPQIETLLAQEPAALAKELGALWAIWRDDGSRAERLAEG